MKKKRYHLLAVEGVWTTCQTLQVRVTLSLARVSSFCENFTLKINFVNSHHFTGKSKRTRANYSAEVTGILMKWFEDNINNPYPKNDERELLWNLTGLSRKQLRVWFIDARRVSLTSIDYQYNIQTSNNTYFRENLEKSKPESKGSQWTKLEGS